MLIVTGSVTARTDTFEALLEAALAHVARSRTEPGCLIHSVHVDCEDPMRLFFYEEWEFMAAVRELAQASTRVRILPVEARV